MLLNVSLHKPRPAAGSTRMYLGEVKNNYVYKKLQNIFFYIQTTIYHNHLWYVYIS